MIMAEKESTAKQAEKSPAEGSTKSEVMRSPASGGLFQPSFDPFFLSPREFFTASPFSLMRRMAEEMDRAFGGFGMERGRPGNVWSPAIEVSEREGNYVVHAELPGLKPEDVKVEIGEQGLVIEGERKFNKETNEGGVRRTERQYGHFYRNIPLPEGVNPGQVKANFQDGVLEVTVPVPQSQSNRRQIPIETGSSGTARTGSSQAAKA
jgi:HSP20 family protein